MNIDGGVHVSRISLVALASIGCRNDMLFLEGGNACPSEPAAAPAEGYLPDSASVAAAASVAITAVNDMSDRFPGAEVVLQHTLIPTGTAEWIDFGPNSEHCLSGSCWRCPTGVMLKVPVSHQVAGTYAGAAIDSEPEHRALYAAPTDPAETWFVLSDWTGETALNVADELREAVLSDPSLHCDLATFHVSVGARPADDRTTLPVEEQTTQRWLEAASHGDIGASCQDEEVRSSVAIGRW
ncbi:MAG: hypothetical protein ABMA64_32430 [Myxococcota bacterium]